MVGPLRALGATGLTHCGTFYCSKLSWLWQGDRLGVLLARRGWTAHTVPLQPDASFGSIATSRNYLQPGSDAELRGGAGATSRLDEEPQNGLSPPCWLFPPTSGAAQSSCSLLQPLTASATYSFATWPPPSLRLALSSRHPRYRIELRRPNFPARLLHCSLCPATRLSALTPGWAAQPLPEFEIGSMLGSDAIACLRPQSGEGCPRCPGVLSLLNDWTRFVCLPALGRHLSTGSSLLVAQTSAPLTS